MQWDSKRQVICVANLGMLHIYVGHVIGSETRLCFGGHELFFRFFAACSALAVTKWWRLIFLQAAICVAVLEVPEW
jgi:hypothetical protein